MALDWHPSTIFVCTRSGKTTHFHSLTMTPSAKVYPATQNFNRAPPDSFDEDSSSRTWTSSQSAAAASELDSFFDGLKITADTTLSRARKIKKEEHYEGCALCLKKFKTMKEIKSHVTKHHRASAKEVRKDLDEATAAYAKDANSINSHNLRLAKVRKHFLVRVQHY